jgi:NAD(P)-dependent dehydrogenase (short-subunit alcohol dehydrogenase family)
MFINPLDLTGKKYLITGAASGLGKAACILLSSLGADLILVDINEEGIGETKRSCKATDISLTMDLTNPVELKNKIIDVVAQFGKLNGIVHLAGRPYVTPLKGISQKTTNDVFMLNTYAAIELAKTFVNKKVQADENLSIVLISSVYGLVGSAANVGYAMSKSALHGITKSLAIELAPKKIRVNCIAPGFIKTQMFEDLSNSFDNNYTKTLNDLHPLGLGEPSDVANAVAYLLSDMSKWVTGTILSVDGGFTAQ